MFKTCRIHQNLSHFITPFKTCSKPVKPIRLSQTSSDPFEACSKPVRPIGLFPVSSGPFMPIQIRPIRLSRTLSHPLRPIQNLSDPSDSLRLHQSLSGMFETCQTHQTLSDLIRPFQACSKPTRLIRPPSDFIRPFQAYAGILSAMSSLSDQIRSDQIRSDQPDRSSISSAGRQKIIRTTQTHSERQWRHNFGSRWHSRRCGTSRCLTWSAVSRCRGAPRRWRPCHPQCAGQPPRCSRQLKIIAMFIIFPRRHLKRNIY